MNDAERDPHVVAAEMAGYLALIATRRLYERQPALWDRGESGRAHTLADFEHHFRALSMLDEPLFEGHVAYCRGLFTARGFPLRWLDDAWAVMLEVTKAEGPEAVATIASRILSKAGGPTL